MKSILTSFLLIMFAIFACSTFAHDKVVVIPLGADCPAGLSICGGKCVDTQNNPAHCGGCASVCDTDLYCNQGHCKSQTGDLCIAHSDCLSGKCFGNACTRAHKLVFVTGVTHSGNLGGLSGADAKCQVRAVAAGLPGSYKAWLSDPSGSPSTRFARATIPYRMPNGSLVAWDYTDLTDGFIYQPINLNEFGYVSPAFPVWTNTTPEGQMASDYSHCAHWYSDGPTAGNAPTGVTTHDGYRWTAQTQTECDVAFGALLYCFEQ